MVLAPRIMKGELEKLPKHYDGVSHNTVGKDRTPSDFEKLQGRLATTGRQGPGNSPTFLGLLINWPSH